MIFYVLPLLTYFTLVIFELRYEYFLGIYSSSVSIMCNFKKPLILTDLRIYLGRNTYSTCEACGIFFFLVLIIIRLTDFLRLSLVYEEIFKEMSNLMLQFLKA